MCDLNDLPSLDDVLYDNLRKLRKDPVSIWGKVCVGGRVSIEDKVCVNSIICRRHAPSAELPPGVDC